MIVKYLNNCEITCLFTVKTAGYKCKTRVNAPQIKSQRCLHKNGLTHQKKEIAGFKSPESRY